MTIWWQTGRVALAHEGERVGQSDWQDIHYEGIIEKAPPCPERRMRTPMPQQSSSSTREEESQCSSVEDRRKRCVAFEDAPKEC